MIERFEHHTPRISPHAFVHANATIIGEVEIGAYSSIWPACVLRGDMGLIRIGEETSIQDGTIAHVTTHFSQTLIGNRVTVGHRVILHGAIVHDDCLIGMGAILLDNCEIGEGSLVAAGSLVTVGTQIPKGSLVMGSPAKVIRPVSEKDRAMIEAGRISYVDHAKRYMAQRQ